MFLQPPIVLRLDWIQVAALGTVMSLILTVQKLTVTVMTGAGQMETAARTLIKLSSAAHASLP